MGSTAFELALQKLLGIERGYVDDPVDRGGKTRFGITEATARAHGYGGPMAQLPLEVATRVYRAQYWDLLRLDAVSFLSYSIADELFDTGVNMGVGKAGEFLQIALNGLNRDQADYEDLVVDGLVGPMTLHALRQFLGVRGVQGESVLVRALNAQQGARYLDIARNDRSQERFVFGWFLNRVA